jgi:hypothetical protein
MGSYLLWLGSLFIAVIFATAAVALSQGNLQNWHVAVALIIWLLLGAGLSFPGDFAEDVAEPVSYVEVKKSTESTPADKIGEEAAKVIPLSLEESVGELARQLSHREREIVKLQERLAAKENKRLLVRLASIQDTASFTFKLVGEGKLTEKDALEQIRMELSSAMGDLGLEEHRIKVGDKINALPAGSFALVKVDPNPPPGLEGTVKEVLNDGLYAHDGTKATFLIPSRIHAYKL